MLEEFWPLASPVLTQLATQVIASIPGWTLRRLRGSAEGAALRSVMADSLCNAFLDARDDRHDGDDAWLEAVAREWLPAFTPEVCSELLAALGGGQDGARDAFTVIALAALRDAGCDVAELTRVLDVEEFLFTLPEKLYERLNASALVPDSALRGAVSVLLQQRAVAVAQVHPADASPRVFRGDLTELLQGLEAEALSGGLPRFVPSGRDIRRLTVPVRVREGIRSAQRRHVADRPEPYDLLADLAPSGQPYFDWQSVSEREPRVVVLADPGMGKSWLMRCETARLARSALDAISAGTPIADVLVPIPMRCDELAASRGKTLADAATFYLGQLYGVPERSHRRLREQIAAGRVMLLLDALDELPGKASRKRIDDLLGRWAANPAASFRITSRVAGYAMPPTPPGTTVEVELQPLTTEDVSAMIAAQGLPPELTTRLKERISDPGMANVARIPLLTALLCATASEDEELPTSTAEIYDRMLRRFLAQENHWPRAPVPEPTDIDRVISILAPLAYHFAARPDGWADRMPANQIMAVLRSLGPVITELNADPATILRDLSVRTGVLIPASAQRPGQNPPYLFLHRTVAEYLVAYHLASLPREEWLPAVSEHLWFDLDWGPAIGLLGAAFVQQERPAEALFLIRYLLGQSQDPFHTALFRAARIVAELPVPDMVPAEVVADMSERMISLLDSETVQHGVGKFLGNFLTRLPPQVTETLLVRLEADQGFATEEILAHSRDDRVIAVLLGRLDDTVDRAEPVFRALRGHDSPAVIDALLEEFDHPRNQPLAAEALQGCATPAVVDRMLERITDPSPRVRYYATEVLSAFEDERAVLGLCDLVSDTNDDVRYTAVTALTARRSQSATQALLTIFDDPDDLIRLIVRSTIISADRVTLPAILSYARDRDSGVRARAADALAALNTAPDATQTLLELAADPEPSVRRRAANSLSCHSGQAARNVLIGLLADADCHSDAARALGSHDTPEVTTRLLDWLSSCGEPACMIAGAVSLTALTSAAVTSTLLRYSEDSDNSTRAAFMTALGNRPDARAIARLVRGLTEDPSHEVRTAAATAMRLSNDRPEVIFALLRGLRDSSDPVREASARAIGVCRDRPEVTSALIERLRDTRQAVRDLAAWQLQECTTPSALGQVCKFSENAQGAVLVPLYFVAAQLANEIFRQIPSDQQSSTMATLAALTKSATRPGPPLTREPTADPDKPVRGELLDTELVILLQGNNLQGVPVYSYIKLTGRRLRRLFISIKIGVNFKPSDWGTVIAAGLGTPPPNVVEEMLAEYNMLEVPIPTEPLESAQEPGQDPQGNAPPSWLWGFTE